ncbi:MAG: DUF3347 domain-containing protein [Flavobacteriaceae bacterium]|nr:DUF3347 domain-containing protein [Flavobacteriaceae bacterium]
MKKSIYVLVVIALTFTACKNEKKTEDHHESEKTEMHDNSDGHHDNDKSSHDEERNIKASSDKNSATSAMIDGYLEIKNGLVSDDKSAAAKGGKTLLNAFASFDMSKLSGDQHKEYMEIVENATEQAEHIVKSPIDHQREHFEVLSEDMNDIIALLGTEKTLFQDFCPMANKGKGAMWLSEFKEIKNPFYGSKMMECGKVQKQIN